MLVKDPPTLAPPPDLVARLADARSEVSALVPVVAGAVAAYRDALAFLVAAVPPGTNIYDVDEALERWATETGARDLSGVLSDLSDLIWWADEPACTSLHAAGMCPPGHAL